MSRYVSVAVMIRQVRPALLLLHGFTHTGASWEPVVAALGERYRALTPDIRGHGAASDSEPVTLEAVIDDLALVAPPGYVLVGYSMGGRLALHFALARPGGVERLVLVGASPGIADEHEREQRRRDDERLAAEIDRLTIEEFARRWARNPVLTGLADEVAARAHADRLRSTPAGLARALRGLGTGALPPLWDRLQELDVPVSLVVGERDQKFRQIATRMQGVMPQAELVTIEGAGHAAHLEAPERVAGVISAGGGIRAG